MNRFCQLYFLVALICFCCKVQSNENIFKEELLIRPFPSGHIYSHFEFTTLWSNRNIQESIGNYESYSKFLLI